MAVNTSNTTVNETGVEVLWHAFKLALRDLVSIIPSILIALAIVAIYLGIAILLTRIIRRIFRLFRVDELLRPFIKRAPFSLTGLIVVLVNIGLALLAAYSITLTLFPGQAYTMTLILSYAARVASVIFLVLFVLIALEAVIEHIRIEAKMRGFILLLVLFISIVPVLDITALSYEVKTALAWGVSIGVGLAIGVFSAWFFFHEILESIIKSRKEQEK